MYLLVILIFLFLGAIVSKKLYTNFYRKKTIDKLKFYDESFEIKKTFINDDKRKRINNPLRILSRLIPNFKRNEKRNEKLERELVMADIPITVDELLIIKILSSAVFVFLTYAFFNNLIITVLVSILVWNIPKLIILRRKNERLKLFDSQLNEGTMIISNSLKVGYSFLQAIAVVVEETKDPFSKEFKKLLKEMSLGISEEEALKNLLLRVESEDLKLIMNAILIQKDTGGNLSEILDNISQTIRERQKIKNELKTLTAQGKLSGIIVILMPIILGIVIYISNKEYMMVLFTTQTGIIMVIFSVISQIIGIFIIRKIINIDM